MKDRKEWKRIPTDSPFFDEKFDPILHQQHPNDTDSELLCDEMKKHDNKKKKKSKSKKRKKATRRARKYKVIEKVC